MATDQGEGIAKRLVQMVTGNFHSANACLVVDQLVRKPAYRDDELAKQMGNWKIKDVDKTLFPLVEEGIAAVFKRLEKQENRLRETSRSYYYIDYAGATDAIKWRMWKMQNEIDVKARNELDTQGYKCPRCAKTFPLLDAGTLFDPYRAGLFCDVCGTAVVENETEQEARVNKDRLKRFIEETQRVRELLKQMDTVVLKPFDVKKWIDLNGPDALAQSGPQASTGKSYMVNGVSVQLANDDDEEREKQRREEEAAAKRAQNQVPTWHQSTALDSIIGATSLAFTDAGDSSASAVPAAEGAQDPQEAQADESDLAAYYASMRQQAQAVDSSHSASPDPDMKVEVKKEDSPSDDEMFVETMARAVQAGFDANASDEGPSFNGVKRTREELDASSPAAQDVHEEKRMRVDPGSGPPIGEAEDDDDDDVFEELDVEDTDPLVSVGGRMVRYSEVTEEMQNDEMTTDEYKAFFEVFNRLS